MTARRETITSTSITEIESVASTQSRIYPAPPLNSPMTLSEVGDRELPNAVSRSNLPTLVFHRRLPGNALLTHD